MSPDLIHIKEVGEVGALSISILSSYVLWEYQVQPLQRDRLDC